MARHCWLLFLKKLLIKEDALLVYDTNKLMNKQKKKKLKKIQEFLLKVKA